MTRRLRTATMTFLTVLTVLGAVGAIPQAAAAAEAPADTVRSNLWVARALMTDVMREGFAALPPDADGVMLEPLGRHDALDVMQIAAYDIAEDLGLTAYLPVDPEDDEDGEEELDSDWGPPTAEELPYVLSFRLEDVNLAYPDSGRRLGLWRTWVDRDVAVSAVVTLRDRRSGRLLFDDRVVRRFGDRVPSGRFDALGHPAYDFTYADVGASGPAAIIEEVVVLSALAGLVMAYFATTGN